MKEFKGTPGPWSVHTIGPHWNNKSLTHIEVTFGSEGECVCDTVYQLEDAKLIAAAPELLKELLKVQKVIENSDYWWMQSPDRGGFDSESIDAVIAKALGE